VITKVVRGWRTGGLIAYLLGPGRAEEHRRPRVIASWDGLDAGWQPARTGPGEWDLDLGPLITALRTPTVAAGLSERADPAGRPGYVWHCSARLAAADRVLGDDEWAAVARELLEEAGIAAVADPGGPRWVAVRHADDHIHIAVVLVRQDTCRRFWPYLEYPRLREAARGIERRLGLTLTAGADGTAAPAPSRGELEKERREGREPARIELARAVREAAVASHDAESFIAALCSAGYDAQLRWAPSGDPIGYKVGRRGDVNPAGEPIFHSGSKLAPDLSLPKLAARWDGRPVNTAENAVSTARWAVERARTATRAGGDEVSEIAHAAADVQVALRDWPGAGAELVEAADVFDRAARSPRQAVSRPGSASRGLRRAARLLIRQRSVAGDGELGGLIALTLGLVALVQEIAAWQRERGRLAPGSCSSRLCGLSGALDVHGGRYPPAVWTACRRSRARPGYGRERGPVPRV
jgi:hypothetical protein